MGEQHANGQGDRPTGGERNRRPAFEQFTAIRRYQPTLSFSPDGSEIAYVVNTSGQFNLWRQSTRGGYPHQVTTFHDQSVRQVAWSPGGEMIAFAADRAGDEFQQLYIIPARGGLPEALTEAPGVRHQMAGQPWSPDGRQIAYGGNDREPTDQDILIRDVAGAEVGRPLANGSLNYAAAWSPDGSSLSIANVRSNTDTDVGVLSLTTGEYRNLTPHEGEVQYSPGPWAHDGSGIWIVSDEGQEFSGLAFLPIEGPMRWVETPDGDIEQVVASADGRHLAWVVNEGGYSRLAVRDLTTGESVSLPEMPRGVIGTMEMSPAGDQIGMIFTEPNRPAEVYVLHLSEGELVRLTHGMLGGIDPDDLVVPDLIHYPSHDGRDIPAWLYRPAGAGPFPVVLSIHGGPEAQERANYSGLYQYLLSRGIGVMAPNVRGSTGYGKTYQKLIHHDWGGAELGDFKAAAEYLRGLDWVDPDRLGVYGGSFGGFATLSCVSRLPEYWAAAVDIVGPSNLVTFAKAVPPTWRRMMAAWVGDPETEVDFLMERSPITYVDQIRTPLFVIQGANDPRVVKGESDQIVERLRERGVDVRYDVYEDEGHGFTKRTNELKAMGDTAAFFEAHLLA